MKTLAIGFHKGALDSLCDVIEGLETWLVPISNDEFHYNMTHERALMLWNKYKEKFNQYDVIITTDTTPLSRIFLQGGYDGRLIIWICNRFDYADGNFRFDKEYYDLLERANFNPNVTIASYSKYDRLYAFRYGIFVDEIIKPVFNPIKNNPIGAYHIPDYQNNYTFNVLDAVNFNCNIGRYGDDELDNIYAFVHLPYHWQGIHEQKSLSRCIPFYVPTKRLFFELLATNKYWFQNKSDTYHYIDLCNFYDKENKAVYYFDSIKDIQPITVDRGKIYDYAKELYLYNKTKWEYLIWN